MLAGPWKQCATPRPRAAPHILSAPGCNVAPPPNDKTTPGTPPPVPEVAVPAARARKACKARLAADWGDDRESRDPAAKARSRRPAPHRSTI